MDRRVAKQKAHFDQIAQTYNNARKHANHLEIKRLIWDHFLASRPFLGEQKLAVLEPMCGFADGLEIIRSRFDGELTYKGFDYSEAVVEMLRGELKDVCVWQQDVTQFESDVDFDLIILLGGLHHVAHVAPDVVKNLARHLRPGGYFINLEPTHGNRLFQAIREAIYRRNALFDEETERAFAPDELHSMFENAGLEPEDKLYPGLLTYVLYYNPDAFPWLNLGSPSLVRFLWSLEKHIVGSAFARTLSFATLTLWRQPVGH